MVKLEEVEDEELDQAQPGPVQDSEDDGDYVDTGPSTSLSHLHNRARCKTQKHEFRGLHESLY